jgi:predicted 3-demethylubiquinone-9 3-methyltransferase (glyoxalase superfamily)
MQRITPFLWFLDQAEGAVAFYSAIFKDAKVVNVARYGEAGAQVSGKPAGSVMAITFELAGQRFVALNGGPVYTFSPAISFVVSCGGQEEVDWFWEKLSEGGEKQVCGWLRDKFGVTWQVVPAILDEMLLDPDPVKAERVMQAMLRMTKIDIAGLKKAYA